MESEFSGSSVVVTGAGRGMGRSIAEAFTTAGASVMIGARTMSFAEQARDDIRASGGTVEIHQVDVKRKSECEALVAATAAAFGGIDVVVHCAADIPHGGVGHVSDEALDAGFDSIAKAAWWLLEAARPHLARSRQGGRFVAIGSVAGTATIVPNMTAYGMAKAAVGAFVRGAALDVAADRITVNAVNPGLIASARAQSMMGDAALDAFATAIPVGRVGTSEDIAYVCLFLASPKAGYITGAEVRIDGGSSLAASTGASVLQESIKAQARR